MADEEVQRHAALEDFAQSIGSVEIPHSPLTAVLTALEYKELKQRAAAKADPSAFAVGNRRAVFDRIKTVVPALKRGGRRAGVNF